MTEQWQLNITPEDWSMMTPEERESIVYSILGIKKQELAQMIAETETESPHAPNAFFVSYKTLAKMPITIRHIELGQDKSRIRLTIIPMDADEGYFKIAVVDPWDGRWEHLFYT